MTPRRDLEPREKQVANEKTREGARQAGPASLWADAGRKYVVEAIGTFFLVFTVTVSVLSTSPFTPLAAGAVLMVMIYAGGHISGAHYNPAVTLAVLLRRRIELRDAIAYWIAQVVAGVIAAVIAHAIVNPASDKPLHPAG